MGNDGDLMDLPKTRAEAKARGLTRYFTGEPCPHGHVAERFASTRQCCECLIAHKAKNRERYREKAAQYSREYYWENREECLRKGRSYHQKNATAIKLRTTRYRRKNADKIAKVKRAYNERNAENNSQYSRAYYQRNRDESLLKGRQRWARLLAQDPDYRRDLYRKRKQEVLAKAKEWKATNKGRVNSYGRGRKSCRKKATPSWLNNEQRDEMANIYEQAVLAEKLTGVPHHVDHIEPLQGRDRCGLHVPWNLQILTAEENVSKGNRTVRHFHWKKL